MRGSQMAAKTWRATCLEGRPPTLGTSMVSSGETISPRQQPYLILIFSAAEIGVLKPKAISLVRFCPPRGTAPVYFIALSAKIAMSLVPPPISTMATPISLSSSVKIAFEEARASSTMSVTSILLFWQERRIFCAEVTEPVTICTFTSRRTPLMPSGSIMPR